MSYRETEHLRVLIANERKDRLALVVPIVAALGHEVIAREIEVADVGTVTARERPDVALVGLGESSGCCEGGPPVFVVSRSRWGGLCRSAPAFEGSVCAAVSAGRWPGVLGWRLRWSDLADAGVGRSGQRGQRADSGQCGEPVCLPGPAGWEVQGPLSALAGPHSRPRPAQCRDHPDSTSTRWIQA